MLNSRQEKEIRKILNDKQLSVLNNVLYRDEIADYFFSTKSDLIWFFPLKIAGVFDPSKAPGVEILEDGSYRVLQWRILTYLERVSEQVTQPDNDLYIGELLKIIKEVSEASKEEPEKNFYTWWSFAIILSNIPNPDVPLEIIELVPDWLKSKHKLAATGSEIITKLLPKFLNNKSSAEDIRKAEIIIRAAISLEWIESKTSFKESYDPICPVEPYWLFEAFIKGKLAEKAGRLCSDELFYYIANQLRAIIRKDHPKHSIDFGYKEKTYRITVSHEEDFEFCCTIGLFRDKPESDDKEQWARYFREPDEKILSIDITECRDKETFVSTIHESLITRQIIDSEEPELVEELAKLYDNVFSDFSYIWFQSISEPDDQRHFGTKELFVLIVRDLLLAKVKKNPNSLEQIISSFSVFQYPLYTRFLIYVFGERWKQLKRHFWELLDESDEPLFEHPTFESELYVLLEKNAGRLTKTEKKKITALIELGPQKYERPNKESLAYWRQKWYSALQTDPDFAKLYREQKAITDDDVQVEFRRERIRHGFGESPKDVESLLSMSNTELAEFLRDFRTENEYDGPTAEGLSAELKNAVKSDPKKFTDDLTPFIETDFYYITDIAFGLKEAWREKKQIDWENVLGFFLQYINRDDFWKDRFDYGIISHFHHDHLCVIGEVADLLSEGTKSDDWTFDKNLLPLAEKILFLVADHMEVKEDDGYDNPLSHALFCKQVLDNLI